MIVGILSKSKDEPEEPEWSDAHAEGIGELESLARQFMTLGFTGKQALQLALEQRSPSAAREMLKKKGCTNDLAFRILL